MTETRPVHGKLDHHVSQIPLAQIRFNSKKTLRAALNRVHVRKTLIFNLG